jgi:hypothetical protein
LFVRHFFFPAFLTAFFFIPTPAFAPLHLLGVSHLDCLQFGHARGLSVVRGIQSCPHRWHFSVGNVTIIVIIHSTR